MMLRMMSFVSAPLSALVEDQEVGKHDIFFRLIILIALSP
jgi:hypothetical protein